MNGKVGQAQQANLSTQQKKVSRVRYFNPEPRKAQLISSSDKSVEKTQSVVGQPATHVIHSHGSKV